MAEAVGFEEIETVEMLRNIEKSRENSTQFISENDIFGNAEI